MQMTVITAKENRGNLLRKRCTNGMANKSIALSPFFERTGVIHNYKLFYITMSKKLTFQNMCWTNGVLRHGDMAMSIQLYRGNSGQRATTARPDNPEGSSAKYFCHEPRRDYEVEQDSWRISVVMQIKNMQNDSKYVPLSDQARAIILGTILGDGSLKIQKKYSNANLQIRHSETQKEYLLWKAQTLKEISGDRSVSVQKADGYSKNKKWRFVSKRLLSLTELHRLTYRHNTLRIKRNWLNQMTPLSLAIWWCDDGSLISYGGRKGVFCTDGFDKTSVKILAHYLKVVWNIRAVIAPVGRKRDGKQKRYWRIWIRSQEELKKLLRIILPYLPVPSMLKKTILLYKDSQLQQRWISEMVQLSHFPLSVVTTEYEKKRAKWNCYR